MTKAFEIALSIIQSVAIVVALVISIRAFHADEARTSAETMLKYAELLNAGSDGRIYDALDTTNPSLKSTEESSPPTTSSNFLETWSFWTKPTKER